MTENGILKNEVDIHKQIEVEALMSGASPSDVATDLVEAITDHARIGQRKKSVFAIMKEKNRQLSLSQSGNANASRNSKGTTRRQSSMSTSREARGSEPRGSEPRASNEQEIEDAGLAFNKEEVLATPFGSQQIVSPLSRALAARPVATKEIESNTNSSDRMQVRVFIPISASDQDGDELETFMDINVLKKQTGLGLIRECLELWKKQNLAAGKELKTDPQLYELRIAEEDGEVDDDMPALNLATSIEEIGQSIFVIVVKEADEDRQAETAPTSSSDQDDDLQEAPHPNKRKPTGCCTIQ